MEVRMIEGVQSVGSVRSFGAMPSLQQLSEEDKEDIQSILSEYDPDNLTVEDAKNIFAAFSEAGIQPAAGMREAIEAAGFDAEKLRTMAMPNNQPPPPPQGGRPPGGAPPGGMQQKGQGLNVSALQDLQDILSEYDLSNLSSDEEDELITKLNDSGVLQAGNLFELEA
jgi:hypothetical protein